MDEAIRTLQREQPQLFVADQVLSVGAYYVGLIKILDRKGLCADTEGEELAVAKSASYNEQYDVLSAKNGARSGRWLPLDLLPSAVPLPSRGCPRSRRAARWRPVSRSRAGESPRASTTPTSRRPSRRS